MAEENKDECKTGSKSCCCGGKKFVMGLIAGALLVFAAIGICSTLHCKSGKYCHMMGDKKICPITGVQTQAPAQVQ